VAQTDYFLKVDGAPGESKGKDGEIDILSFHGSVSNEGTSQDGGGSGGGRARHSDYSFTSKLDKSDPKLYQMCATGEHIPKVVFTARKAGKEQQEYFKITFSDGFITNYSVSGSSADHSIPVGTFSLNYSKKEIEYKEQQKDGTLGGATKAGFDLKTSKKV
jgi:type VI secretion system secreted protein Hcp